MPKKLKNWEELVNDGEQYGDIKSELTQNQKIIFEFCSIMSVPLPLPAHAYWMEPSDDELMTSLSKRREEITGRRRGHTFDSSYLQVG